ncbi:uncharacterized protein N7483_004686 [Penicillium malachiteum]|uniref:uncharacterized protein n=1 Tax=Penicillium malachiteum TaxID=1324776 RepID=UPI0025467E57|nr:uncharacterized protein N7483_004686 [Penicillium malachiteum]KAJ5730178.1 hypothetical protein N7483_004686 [Penicillium malachiteum]
MSSKPATVQLRVQTILTTSDQWITWLSNIQAIANLSDVWKYIDPEVAYPPQLGPKPQLLSVRDVYPNYDKPSDQKLGTKSASDQTKSFLSEDAYLAANPEQARTFFGLEGRSKRTIDDWKETKLALDNIFITILNTVSSDIRKLFGSESNSHVIMRSLYERFNPDSILRSQRMADRWIGLRTIPRSNIMKWLDQWESTYVEAKTLQIVEMGTEKKVCLDFLRTITVLSDPFATHWKFSLMNLPDSSDQISFLRLLRIYRDHISSSTIRLNKFLSNATFKGEDDSSQTSDEKEKKKGTKQRFSGSCPCGEGKHSFVNCPVLNPAKRPDRWKLSDETKTKFDTAMEKSSTLRAAMKRAKERISSDQKSADPVGSAETSDEKGHMVGMTLSSKKSPLDEMKTLAASLPISNATNHVIRPNEVWAYDTGSTLHICNNIDLFSDIQPYAADVCVGDTTTPIVGIGTVLVRPTESLDGKPLTLLKVGYSPGFHLNLISASIAERSKLFLNGRKRTLETSDGTPVCRLNRRSGVYLIRWDGTADGLPSDLSASTRVAVKQLTCPISSEKPFHPMEGKKDPIGLKISHQKSEGATIHVLSSYSRPEKPTSRDVWHQRLGHIGQETLDKLIGSTTGVRIDQNLTSDETCETCKLSDSYRQLSRVPIERHGYPFEAIHWDLVFVKQGIDGMKYLSHCVCPVTKYQFAKAIRRKVVSPDTLHEMIAHIELQYGTKIRRIHIDNDTTLPNFIKHMSRDGRVVESTPIDQPKQNPYAERYGGLIVQLSRRFIQCSGLPISLWPYAAACAVYVMNRTPRRTLGWKTPYQTLWDRLDQKPGHMTELPDLSNIRVFGCKCYIRIINIPRLDKMKVRAQIGYLVGYVSSNIWLIWLPRGKVIKARDVEFDETSFYKHHERWDEKGAPLYDDSMKVVDYLDISEYTTFRDQLDQSETSDENVFDTFPENHDVMGDLDENEQVLDENSSSEEETCDEKEEDQIIGDQPDTPPQSDKEGSPDPEDPSYPNLHQADNNSSDLRPMGRIEVQINNNGIDQDEYPLYEPPYHDRDYDIEMIDPGALKRSLDEGPDDTPDKKRARIANFLHAYNVAMKSQPKKVHVTSVPPAA